MTLVERLRAMAQGEARSGIGRKRRELFEAAADALEALLAENDDYEQTIRDVDKRAIFWKARAEKAELERDAALFDKAVECGKTRMARSAALEKAARVAERITLTEHGISDCEYAAAIRALAGDKP